MDILVVQLNKVAGFASFLPPEAFTPRNIMLQEWMLPLFQNHPFLMDDNYVPACLRIKASPETMRVFVTLWWNYREKTVPFSRESKEQISAFLARH